MPPQQRSRSLQPTSLRRHGVPQGPWLTVGRPRFRALRGSGQVSGVEAPLWVSGSVSLPRDPLCSACSLGPPPAPDGCRASHCRRGSASPRVPCLCHTARLFPVGFPSVTCAQGSSPSPRGSGEWSRVWVTVYLSLHLRKASWLLTGSAVTRSRPRVGFAQT